MKITIQNNSFNVDPSDHKAYWEYINSGEWEKETFQLIDKFASSDDIFIDVGSWAGPITFYAASIVEQVYAIEPDPAIYPQLIHNLSLNPELKIKVQCFQLALSNSTGKQALYARTKYGQSSSSLLARSRDKLSSELCSTISLSDFVSQNNIPKVDFIKLDIEGGEFSLLTGLTNTLDRLNHPSLLISFHYNHLKESIYKQKMPLLFLSKLFMRLEGLIGVEFFKATAKNQIVESLQSLTSYKYVYTDQAKRTTLDALLNNVSAIKNQSFVFSNKPISLD